MPERVRPAGPPVMSCARPQAGRAACLAAAGLGAWLAAIQTARAQGLLPAVGADVRVGDLRGQFARAFDEVPLTNNSTTWTYTPSIGATETFDSGVHRQNGTNGADLITRLTPELDISGESSRLQGTFDYAPTAAFYAKNGNLNGIEQNLNANGSVTLVPDLLFLELRGYSGTSSYYTGVANNTLLQTSQQVTSSSFSATPTLRHQFGDYGQLLASYGVTRTLIDASKVVPTPGEPAPASNYGNSTSYQQNASFTTGDAFGQIRSVLSAALQQTAGGGATAGERSTVFNDQISYAVTRLLALTAAFGHEDIVYSGASTYKVDDITWSGGIELTPNADSDISISYGHSQGGTSLSLDATYAPTQRTRVYARYSQGVGTQQDNLRQAVNNSIVGAGGQSIDPITGAPLQVNPNTIGYLPGLFRTTRMSLSGVILFTLDTVTVTIERDNSQNIDTTTTGQSFDSSSSGTSGTVAWSHVFTDALNANSTLQYGTNSYSGPPSATQTTVSVSVSLGYAISQTLNATASATFADTSGVTYGYPSAREVVVVGLRKTF